MGLGTDVAERMASWRSGGAIDADSGIWHYVPFAPLPWGAFPGLRGRKAVDAASWLTRPLLAAALRRAGFDRPQLAYADHFLQEGLLRAVSPERVLFRRADNLAGFPGAGADFAEREVEFARRADLTICTTESSAAHMAKEGVNRPMVVPNGIQLDRFFDDAPVPVEYLGDDRPIVVYVGAAEHRLDIDLMVRGMTELRQFRWVVIGPFDGAARERLRAAGAHLLGSRPHASLAGYLQHAHVGIVPFSFTRHGELIREVSPLKVLEYAASGLPVVGMKGCQYPTDLPTPLSICGTADAFLQAVKRLCRRSQARAPRHVAVRLATHGRHGWGRCSHGSSSAGLRPGPGRPRSWHEGSPCPPAPQGCRRTCPAAWGRVRSTSPGRLPGCIRCCALRAKPSAGISGRRWRCSSAPARALPKRFGCAIVSPTWRRSVEAPGCVATPAGRGGRARTVQRPSPVCAAQLWRVRPVGLRVAIGGADRCAAGAGRRAGDHHPARLSVGSGAPQ